MHQHAALTAIEWGIGRSEQDELAAASHRNLAAALDRGFFDGLVTPYLGLARDNNLRPGTTVETLAALAPLEGTDPVAGLTAGNSTPLSDGASVVLLASEAWAAARGLPVLAWFAGAQTAAVDHVRAGEGLLMAPAYAVPPMLDRAGLTLQDFDLYEINEAYSAQVLSTLRAWADHGFCSGRLGRDHPLGAIDPCRLNINGGALALGHPFGATGGRILAQTAKALAERESGRALVTICAGGGLGAAAILER
jgi:acetyl-CoA C-acetyltransferase